MRCNKARILKKKIQKAVLELNRCCGYSANIHIQAPLPITGPRAAGLVLDLPDLNGEKALGSKIDLKKTTDESVKVKVYPKKTYAHKTYRFNMQIRCLLNLCTLTL